MEFTINAAALATILPLCSTDKARPILNGFLCRFDGVLGASDGAVMGMVRAAHTAQSDILIKPNADLKRMVKNATGKRAPLQDLTVTFDEPAEESPTRRIVAMVSYFGVTIPCEAESGEYYPRLQNVVPHLISGPTPLVHMAINPLLLAKFGEHAELTFSGPDRAIIVKTRDENFFGLIMPTRSVDEKPAKCPEWVSLDSERQAATTAEATTANAA